MMNEKEFLKSQKECADMLGMTIDEYNSFCKNVKVPNKVFDNTDNSSTIEILNFLGMDDEILKKERKQ